MDFDENKTLAANMSDVSAIVTQLFLDLDAQRVADAEAQNGADLTTFDEYKTAQKVFADALAQSGDSDACAALIAAAKDSIDALNYDESKTLAGNMLDVSAIVTQLISDLAAQRETDAETPDTPDDPTGPENPTEPEQPTEPAGPDQPQTEDLCKWCGEPHTGPMGGFIRFFHSILYFFAHLFGKK